MSTRPTPAASGMNYAPRGPALPVVSPGDFAFGAAFLEHGHIYAMSDGLVGAGARLKWVYDPDPRKLEAFRTRFPHCAVARDFKEILDDPQVRLVASAGIPCDRGPTGCLAMEAGKDYFCDKPPFTSFEGLAQARRAVAATGRKFFCYYSERLHVECAVHAGVLVHGGAIGRVIQVLGLGPHRIDKASRPPWFFQKKCYGGILCDIGSHQFEQFLYYSGATDAVVAHAAVGNYANSDTPELEDFGEASLIGDNGVSNYVRVDWFTPKGLSTWGDGRTVILGTEGYLELRKYVDVARQKSRDHLILVDGKGEQHLDLEGKVGYPFFGDLILDCLHRTDKAMPQAHVFKAAELGLRAQEAAKRIGPA